MTMKLFMLREFEIVCFFELLFLIESDGYNKASLILEVERDEKVHCIFSSVYKCLICNISNTIAIEQVNSSFNPNYYIYERSSASGYI